MLYSFSTLHDQLLIKTSNHFHLVWYYLINRLNANHLLASFLDGSPRMLTIICKQWCSSNNSLKSFDITNDQHFKSCVSVAVITLYRKRQPTEVLCSNFTSSLGLLVSVCFWMVYNIFFCVLEFFHFSIRPSFFTFSLSRLDDLVCTQWTFTDDTILKLFQTYPLKRRFVSSENFPLLR